MSDLLRYGAATLEVLLAALMLGAVRHYGAGSWEKKNWRRLWTAIVFATVAIAAAGMGMGFALLYHLPILYFITMMFVMGGAMWLMVSIPCGLAFFNRRYIRPFRNLAFLALGGWYVYMAWDLTQIWIMSA